MNNINLIVPVAADKSEYENMLPHVFILGNDGITLCIKSIMGLDLDKFQHIYFTILKKHDELLCISDLLRLQFKRLGLKNAEVIVLDSPTQDQAETVYKTIEQANIKGRIFIKDGDSYFNAILPEGNAIATCAIEDLDLLEPKNKSYVSVDDMYYVTNIIEKRVVGHLISAGGYLFDSTELFSMYYNKLRSHGRLYLSHIIYAMLLNNIAFRPILVKGYKDWGTTIIYKMDQI